MSTNDKIWIVVLLIGIFLLWFNSRSNSKHPTPFETIREEQDWYSIRRKCDEKFDRNKMWIFFDCLHEYGRIVRQEWYEGKWINKPKWIWSDKYYEEFDTTGLAKLRNNQ